MKIWQHYWLPIKHPPMIQSSMIDSMEVATVYFLIDAETRKWNTNLLVISLLPKKLEKKKKKKKSLLPMLSPRMFFTGISFRMAGIHAS